MNVSYLLQECEKIIAINLQLDKCIFEAIIVGT